MTKKELTLEDVKKAIDLIKEERKDKTIYEDEYQKIWGSFGKATKIQLKKKGVKLLNDLIEGGEKYLAKDKKAERITTLYGIPVFVEGLNNI